MIEFVCSVVWVDTEYCVLSPTYDFLVVLSVCTQEGVKKMYFQWVAVERKRNI